MADELLSCPFCGSQAAWPEPEVNMNYVQCMSCSATANHAGEWNRRTTPTPATDEREAVARALIVAAGAELVASEKHWPETAAQYYTMCEKYQSYAASHGLVTDAFRNADAALSALAPIRAQEIAAARAEEQGYRHTQVAALKQVHAAEILAARTSGRNDATKAYIDDAASIRTPPTPAAEEREAVAQWCSGCHEVRSVDCYRAGCPKSDTEEREAVAHAIELCATPYISEALAECALSALAPIRAAEILAAEANVTARIVAWLRGESGICNEWDDEWKLAAGDFAQFICFGYHKMTQAEYDAIERNEHGAGK